MRQRQALGQGDGDLPAVCRARPLPPPGASVSCPGGGTLRCPEPGARCPVPTPRPAFCRSTAASAVAEREMGIPVPGWGTYRCPPGGEKYWLKRKVLLRECGGGELPVPRGSRGSPRPGERPFRAALAPYHEYLTVCSHRLLPDPFRAERRGERTLTMKELRFILFSRGLVRM